MKFQSDPHTIIKTPYGELKLFNPLGMKENNMNKQEYESVVKLRNTLIELINKHHTTVAFVQKAPSLNCNIYDMLESLDVMIGLPIKPRGYWRGVYIDDKGLLKKTRRINKEQRQPFKYFWGTVIDDYFPDEPRKVYNRPGKDIGWLYDRRQKNRRKSPYPQKI